MQTLLKKEEIMETTLQLIVEYGLQGFPVSKIAKRANVSIGTIYHYFESKEQLISEIFESLKERLSVIDESSNNINNNDKERYIIFWCSLYEFWRRQPKARIFVEQLINCPIGSNIEDAFNLFPNFLLFLQFTANKKTMLWKAEAMYRITLESTGTFAKGEAMDQQHHLYMENSTRKIASFIWNGFN